MSESTFVQSRLAERGQLSARPSPAGGARDSERPGTHRLQLSAKRDGWIFCPERVVSEPGGRGAPLVVLLHGAGGDARHGISLLQPLAERAGLILLAPASQGSTWDAIGRGFGCDVALLDAALSRTFARHTIDPTRVAIAGFSDGASYALSLGLGNGELFTDIIAFSPGFIAPARREGRPRVFIAHGVADRVLPIDRCSRRIVPELLASGLRVEYHEFADGHVVPAETREAAVRWFIDDGARRS